MGKLFLLGNKSNGLTGVAVSRNALNTVICGPRRLKNGLEKWFAGRVDRKGRYLQPFPGGWEMVKTCEMNAQNERRAALFGPDSEIRPRMARMTRMFPSTHFASVRIFAVPW